MKNYEHYKPDLKHILTGEKDCNIVVCTDDDKLLTYNVKGDSICEITKKYKKVCSVDFLRWLNSEHKEKPRTITSSEYGLCAALKKGYIARDESGDVYYYTTKPVKRNNVWGLVQEGYDDFCEDLSALTMFAHLTFDCVKWEDEEPWDVKDLMKLEVVDK